MNSVNDNTPPRLMTFGAANATSLSRTMLHQRAQAGQFPTPVALGARWIAFGLNEIEAWIDTSVAARAAA